MITSMTGFGRAEARQNGFLVTTEVRSLNHRFLDIDLRLPKELGVFERQIKDLVSSRLARGRVNVTVTVQGGDVPVGGITVDRVLASKYVQLAEDLRQEFGLKGALDVQQLLGFPDIICFEAPRSLDEEIWKTARESIEAALDELGDMRVREGGEIGEDLKSRLDNITGLVDLIERHAGGNAKEAYDKLKKKVESIADSEIVNAGRLEMEVAVLADKADVTEECIRFKSHNKLFSELLDNENSEGRRLNFLLQEMHREANTIGAKANDSQISHWIVDIKEDIEKLREQIQNIE